MWQKPPGIEPPRALLFLAHGMCHGAEDFFGEAGFTGLPEEQRIVSAALAQGFLTVAASSTDRDDKYWEPDMDGPLVAEAIREVLRREGLDPALPCVALGASNGGTFVMHLPLWVPLRAVVCQIMAVREHVLAAMPGSPPVLFVHMPRDTRTAAGVARNVQRLVANGVTAEEQRCGPMSIGNDFFAERCGIDSETSAKMSQSLRDAGLLDDQDFLLHDPRESEWRTVLQPFAAALGDSLVPDRSPISEVLNVAWAEHEITSEGIQAQLDFCLAALR